MAKYFIEVQKNAQRHLQFQHKSGDKASIKRINQIFEDLSEHPETGVGQPEQLKLAYRDFGRGKSIKKTG